MCVPDPSGVSVCDGFQHSRARIRNCELVLAALLAADCNEVPFFAWIDPQRNVMRESLSNWLGRDAALCKDWRHGGRVYGDMVDTNLKVRERGEAGCSGTWI